MGGEQAYGVVADALLGQGVGRDLLGAQGVEERLGRGVLLLVLRPRRCVEQRDDGVEVAVGHPGGHPGPPGGGTETLGPRRAVPEHPERLLDGGPVGQLVADRPQQPRERQGAPLGTGWRGEVGQHPGVEQRLAQQVGRGPRDAALGRGDGALTGAEAAGQDADVGGVHVGERRGQQVGGAHRVDVRRVSRVGDVGVHRDRQGVEQRCHRRLAHQGGVVGGDLDRDPGREERPPQTGDRRASGTDEHRHLRPGDAVLEVGPAQEVGEMLRLRAVGVVGEHLDTSAVGGIGRGTEEPLQRLTRQPCG